ncbi:sigma-70 family RNA polymerase sigma factor [Tissierella creatinophila]|uniref:RNA polymerase sigma factor n=1 Tax=Tissierella creatinophila DSM 6911 TaxID=1123403 RepID=A0A1U7M8U9_TISCR|nr:FliA/WhiG family RNA polymerase sigma factor [Tissierella creatinophila]OLS03753.1 RNA polymerase sigma-D factor [Tissierella creatinophila DSM 6911]
MFYKEEDLDNLIIEYLPLVKKIVGKIDTRNREYDEDDLFSIGVIGLIDALKRFDDKKGAAFETYANIRVRGAIIDELRKLGRVSRNRMDKLNSYYREKEFLENSMMRTPTEKEICESMGLDKKELFEIHETVNDLSYISLESVLFPKDDGDFGIIDLLEDKDALSPQEELIKDEQTHLLELAIESLDEREKIILNLYYVEELTLKEIGYILDISIPRVSQIHSKILLNLRQKIEKLGAK